MDEWEIVVQVRLKADTPDEARAWLDAELRDKLQPDEGTGWHTQGQATPRYTVASIRRIVPDSPTPTYKRGQG